MRFQCKVFSAVLFTSVLCVAGCSRVLAAVSTNLTFVQYEQTIQGANQSRSLEPEEWALDVFYELDDALFVTVNLFQGDWSGDWDARTALALESRGAGVSVSWMDEAWTRTLGVHYGESGLQGQRRDISARVAEDYRYREGYVAVAYDQPWRTVWISPKLKLAWQDSELVQASQIDFRNGQFLSGRDKQEQDGAYTQFSLFTSIDLSAAGALFSPYLLISWNEVLSGQVVSTRERQSNWGRVRSDAQIDNDESEGSGQISLGVSAYVDSVNLDASVSEALNSDEYGRSLALGVGIDF